MNINKALWEIRERSTWKWALSNSWGFHANTVESSVYITALSHTSAMTTSQLGFTANERTKARREQKSLLAPGYAAALQLSLSGATTRALRQVSTSGEKEDSCQETDSWFPFSRRVVAPLRCGFQCHFHLRKTMFRLYGHLKSPFAKTQQEMNAMLRGSRNVFFCSWQRNVSGKHWVSIWDFITEADWHYCQHFKIMIVRAEADLFRSRD